MNDIIKIEDLFNKDIRRDIDGVIKVDKDDDKSVYTELDEYVVTQESLKHFDKFFERYFNATHSPTDKIGVWVSGFFGSGKSHFIKILSYLLENKTVYERSALDFFSEKILDPQLFSTIEKSVKYGTKDVIIFNIDSKANTAGQNKEQIVNIFMRVFNEKRGYFGDVFWIAELEEDLGDKGLYDTFKEEFKTINGSPWEEKRDQYVFEQDDIIEALSNCGYQSRESLERMFENDGRNYNLNVEKFAEKVRKYCRSKGNEHQVIFLVDEIGQYIGENSELMLNLQTVVEELGTKLAGKAWVIVTSQADIDTVTKEKVKGYDFSKIQARFDTRLSLSSANVDEVIKRRILDKKDEYKETLSSFYAEKKTILKNLLSFSRGGAEMKRFKGEEDFVSVYPFVPYQFNILQKVFDKIRQTGFTGKHLAKGERSMLNAFKESTMSYGDSDVGILIPFYSFYDTVESFLDPIIKRTIKQAEKNDMLENPVDCNILKILFMIKHVKEVQPTLDNLVVLSISNVDDNKLELRKKVMESLNRLEEQTLINKTGDTYHFLTNEEQEINREIKNTDIENHSILNEIFNVVYNSNDVCPTKYNDLKFSRSIDDMTRTATGSDLSIKFLTPLSDEVLRGSGQRSLEGDNLSNIDSTDSLLFIFPDDSVFVDQIMRYLKIEKYLKQNVSNRNNPEIQDILSAKRQEAERLRESTVLAIHKGVSDARVFIDGKEVPVDKKNPKERVKEGFEILVDNVYSKSNYITKEYESENDILRILRSDDLERFGVSKAETNKLALEEVLNYVLIRDEKNKIVTLKELKEHFMKKPYGWKDMTLSGLIASLFVGEEIKLRYQKTYLVSNAEEITKYLTRKENADKLIIEIRQKTDSEIISSVKSVLRDVFDKTDIPEKETDLYTFSHGILTDELSGVEKISGKYAEEKRYPGEKDIEHYAEFLKKLQNITDPSLFLENIATGKNEVVELRRKVEPVTAFFNSAQVEIFRRLSKRIDNFKRNTQFLNEEARSDVNEIEEILALDEPYSRIKDLPQLESRIVVSLENSLSDLKQEVLDKLESVKTDIGKELEGQTFTDEFKSSVIDPFDAVRRDTEASDDCAFVKLQITRIEELNGRAYEKIEKERYTSRETGDGDEGIKPVIVEILRGSPLFRTSNYIETEEDIDEYLKNLRASMLEIIKDNKKKIKVL